MTPVPRNSPNLSGRGPAAGQRPVSLAVLLALVIALAGMACLAAAPADAANTRVSISDFQWSKNAQVDLGESVTWDFLGPDLQHSVTGQAPNATQWDSDPGNSMPVQQLGRSYKVTFDAPGTYLFVCKIHSSVRGTVTVSDQPGDPNSDPGPQAPLNFDLEPPLIEDVRFTNDGQRMVPAVIGPKGKGIGLGFSSSDRGMAEVDYYRLVKKGKRKKARTVRKFAGYTEWQTHIGWNLVRFGARSATFKPVAGKYVGLFRATDESSNTTRPLTLRFEIKAKKKPKKKNSKKKAKKKGNKKRR